MSFSKLRVGFMGTPSYAIPTLECLLNKNYDLAMVWTKQASARGRGLKRHSSAVAAWAHDHDIEVRAAKSLRTAEELDFFRRLNLDVAIIVSFGMILPKSFLEVPRLGCLNLHPSLLPRWRGSAPIERALWEGDSKTGVTIMKLGSGIDDGDILAQTEIEIKAMNAGTLYELTSRLGAQLMVESLTDYASGKLIPKAQDESKAMLASRLSAAERMIDWQRAASALLCQIRACAPRPGAWFCCHRGDKKIRLRLLEASLVQGQVVAGQVAGQVPGQVPGQIIDEQKMVVACGKGALKLEQLQRESKKAMAVSDFVRGFPLRRGELLS